MNPTMRTKTKVILITSACTITAMALGGNTPLGQLIWPAKELHAPPSSAQVPAFIIIGLVEAVAFGLGISFLAFGYPQVRRRADSAREATMVYVSIGWLLISWFPHDNLHMFVGEDATGLLALLWGFHATLIAAGLLLARSLVLRKPTGGPRPTPNRSGTGTTQSGTA